MRTAARRFLSLCLGLSLAGCAQGSPQPAATATTPATALAPTDTAPAPAASGDTTGADLLKNLPKCAGIEILTEPVVFDWPNIQERLQELEAALWGYYRCDGAQAQVAGFYRAQMPKPPTNMGEMNWVTREEGDVGVYYSGSSLTWIYLWVVAAPEMPQKSYVIMAETDDPVSGDCRWEPPAPNTEMGASEVQWSHA